MTLNFKDGEHGSVEQIGIQDMSQSNGIDLQAFKAVPEFHNENPDQRLESGVNEENLAYTNLDQACLFSLVKKV